MLHGTLIKYGGLICIGFMTYSQLIWVVISGVFIIHEYLMQEFIITTLYGVEFQMTQVLNFFEKMQAYTNSYFARQDRFIVCTLKVTKFRFLGSLLVS